MESSHPSTLNPQPSTLDERLQNALVRGFSDTLEADLAEALTVYPSAVAIIEGPLMKGMQRVGQLFGEGRMFLPQVVKTARTMKQAVEILTMDNGRVTSNATTEQDSRDKDNSQSSTVNSLSKRVLLATVKGDVHDIGKNIVSVVMGCNGYDIIDLGVMVPAEEIVRKTLECRPAIIGLSGLITPSLSEMVDVAKALRAAGISVPLLIGGATTSAMHTALKIAPVYDGPVVYVKDASQNSGVAAALLSEDTKDAFVEELKAGQEQLRREFNARNMEKLLPIDEAREKRLKLFD